MTFPVVQGRTSASQNTSNSLSLPLPTPVSAGDLIVAMVDTDLPNPVTFPGPWVTIADVNQAPIGGGNVDAHCVVAYLDASGGETTVAIGTSFNTHAAAIAIRITGHEAPGIQPPEVNMVARGDVNVADPPSLTPTGGAEDFLWIAGAGRGSIAVANAAPASYSNLITLATSLFGASCHSAERLLNAASENPGNFTGVWNPDSTVAWLIAVHPTPPPPPGTAALTGTVTDDSEADIRAGGSDIILTLTDDTWVAVGGTFDAQRQNIIDGIDSAQAEAGGWDAQVRPAIPVGNVVRTSDTVVTITLPGVPSYEITADEVVEATIPGTAVALGAPIVATPTFTITNIVEAPSGSILPTGFWW